MQNLYMFFCIFLYPIFLFAGHFLNIYFVAGIILLFMSRAFFMAL